MEKQVFLLFKLENKVLLICGKNRFLLGKTGLKLLFIVKKGFIEVIKNHYFKHNESC